MNIRNIFAEGRFKKYVLYAGIAILGYLLMRGCIPDKSLFPAEVYDSIQRRYVICIAPDQTPIWPGEPRQPECGQVAIEVVGEGIVPQEARAAGVTRAICFRVAYQNPYWTTQGPGVTRHEIKWQSRTASQVTVLQNGVWQLSPDEEIQDRERWDTYSCPASYDSKLK